MERRAKREGVLNHMAMRRVRHQMPALAGRDVIRSGEAALKTASDETRLPRHEMVNTGQTSLLMKMLARDNMQRAWKRVKANKGAAGIDGLDIEQTRQYLKDAWPAIRSQLIAGTYRPSPVRRVSIPKPDGGERELGIPTVIDRLIQQAALQVLQPLLDPTFSEHSHGFRPGRRAHDAVLAAQRHVQEGYRVVVDVDLLQFFDKVNHDILIDRLSKRLADSSMIRLIRTYLNAGMMNNGVVVRREEGMPQGSPLSPLLANVLLDEVDRELERRGHRFERYADDCNVYVRSQKAGRRVRALLERAYHKLHLKINKSKSAVAGAFGRPFLGYTLWIAPGGEVKRAVAKKAQELFKRQVRQKTRRSAGRGMSQVIGKLRSYILGWKSYFCLSQTPTVWRRLDGWVRHRMRAIQLKQWKRGKTMYRALRAMGINESDASKVAAKSSRWWHNSRYLLHKAMTIAYFDRIGMPRLA